MRFIVTGGAGFIGSHVTDTLVARGHEVHVVDDLSTGSRENIGPGVVLHEADIRDGAIASLFRDVAPERVVHLAAQIDLRRSVREPLLDADINIMGGLRVLEAARACGAGHVTFSSTAASYGADKPVPTPEDEHLEPIAPYGVSKVAFEMYLRAYRHLYGMPSAILRFANVYGPRQTVKGEAGVVAIFLDQMKRGERPTVYGDGGQVRDYVYVGDVAEAVALAAESGADATCNVSTGRRTSVNELLAVIKRVASWDTEPIYGPEKPGDERVSCLDPARAKDVLGWEAVTGLEEGIRRTIGGRTG